MADLADLERYLTVRLHIRNTKLRTRYTNVKFFNQGDYADFWHKV